MGTSPEVNPAARRAYAELLRQFASGRCTNFEYENGRDAIRSRVGSDTAVAAIDGALWHTYCDLREHRWDVGDVVRSRVARWVVFLHGEEEMGPLPRAGIVALFGWVLFVTFAIAWLGVLFSLFLGANNVALTCGAAAALAYVLVWVTGITVAPRAAAAAFAREPDDFWPFPSREARARALHRPLLLSGRESRYATAALG